MLAIHDRMLEATRGLQGVRDFGLLFSLVERPKTSLMGQEMYRDIFLKASVVLEALAVYHVFLDGNKRTALTATAVFLAINGYEFNPADEPAFRFIRSVAIKKKTIKQIAVWLKKFSKPLPLF